MEHKEALEQELVVQPAELTEAPAEDAADVVEAASEPAPEETPAENEVPADASEDFRPYDVSDDGSPHGRKFLPSPPSMLPMAASPASSTPKTRKRIILPSLVRRMRTRMTRTTSWPKTMLP